MLRCRSGADLATRERRGARAKRLESHAKRFAPGRPITFRFSVRNGP